MKHFFEEMFFTPKWYHYPLIVILSPLALLYGLMMFIRRKLTAKKDFGIPIVSVGNLIVGGSGKTPFVIALASRYEDVTVISRGYGRESKGLLKVSERGKILTTVEESGDEPMLIAVSLPQASVIVSEERHSAIELAKKEGSKLIIMDDGFNRVEIKKFEILLEPQSIQNILPFPSGAFREFSFSRKYADIVAKEGKSFTRNVSFENLTSKMILVTAISNPQRLDPYLPEGLVKKVYLEDHAYFDEVSLQESLEKYKAKSLLVTEKDAVKMQDFKLPLSHMKLKLDIVDEIFSGVDNYVNSYGK